MFDRAILHLDLDAFFVSVERLKNSKLKNKPLIIAGGSNRGVVSSCSYEARKFGVHSAMPTRMAKRLCPDAVFLQGDMESYIKYSKLVTEIIDESAPLFEKASIDEFYLDLSGMDKYFGTYKWSLELRARIIENAGLPISFGLAVNKLVSKVGAGEAKPNGAKLIDAGTEKRFLAPLSVAKIPSIGKVTYKKLSFMGVRTVETLSNLPVRLLQREFGKHGIDMWRKANAIDDSPVVPYREKKSISTESTYETDTLDVHELKRKLNAMVGKLAFELRRMQKLTSVVTVKIRYADFNTFTKQVKIKHTVGDMVLKRYAQQLFDKLYVRRQMVRLIGVRFGGLAHGHYQIDLFEDTGKEIKLLQEMDNIRRRFGKNAISLGL